MYVSVCVCVCVCYSCHLCVCVYMLVYTRACVCSDLNQQKSRHSHESGSELLVVREKKLVDRYLIKSGMLRFSFLLECCHPGSFPDPQLLAAMLDLVGSIIILYNNTDDDNSTNSRIERHSSRFCTVSSLHHKCLQHIHSFPDPQLLAAMLDLISCIIILMMRSVAVSTSAFLAFHQCYCAGSSLAWGLNLRVSVCGIFWSSLPGFSPGTAVSSPPSSVKWFSQ